MSEQKSWFERNAKKTLFGVLAFFLMLAVGVTEYYFEKNLPEPPIKRSIRLREHTPNMSGVNRPNNKNLEKKDYLFRTDENGYIMPAKVHEAPDLNMVFLGGSTTECEFVDEDYRFAHHAGVLLGERLDKKINSYNAGRNGNNTMHCLDLLLNKVLPMRPDVVVLMENINDVNILITNKAYWNNSRTRSLIVVEDNSQNRLQRLTDTIAETVFPGFCYRLQIGPAFRVTDEFAEEREQRAAERRTNKEAFRDKRAAASRERGTNIDTAQFEANLATFVVACKKRNLMPVLMTQFNRLSATPDAEVKINVGELEDMWGFDYATYKGFLDRFNEIIRRVARENDVLLIDLEAQVPKSGAYMYDIVHLNTEGSKLAAQIIADKMAESAIVQNLLHGKEHSNGKATSAR